MALQDTLNKMYGAVSAEQETNIDAVPMPMMTGQDFSVSMPMMGQPETGSVEEMQLNARDARHVRRRSSKIAKFN